MDPTCRDDLDYTDQAGYYCHHWVGEDCSRAFDDFYSWGYTQADEDAILAHCPYSCLQCTRTSSKGACEQSCDDVTIVVFCGEEKGVAKEVAQPQVLDGPFSVVSTSVVVIKGSLESCCLDDIKRIQKENSTSSYGIVFTRFQKLGPL